MIWLTDTPPSGYGNVKANIHYVANDLYTELSNKEVYPYLSSMFEVGGIKYVPVSISDNTCDAIDCIYTGDPYDVKIDNKVNYKGVDIIVRNINPYTGFHCENIKSIDISSDGEIGNRAFCDCNSLQDVSIGDSVKSIGQEAFLSCDSLSRLALGSGLQAIGESAFYYCNNLQDVSIGDNVKSIGQEAFSYCDSLSRLALGSGLQAIGERAFYYCNNLQDVSIGDSVKSIGQEAFSGCHSLSRLALGSGLQAIGESAFSSCYNLTEIYSEALTPPTCGAYALGGIDKWTCKLIVPKGSIEAYKQADQWKEFFFIEENTTGIQTMTSDKEPRSDVYSLTGAKVLDNASLQDVQSLPKGIYVIKGKKIIVK